MIMVELGVLDLIKIMVTMMMMVIMMIMVMMMVMIVMIMIMLMMWLQVFEVTSPSGIAFFWQLNYLFTLWYFMKFVERKFKLDIQFAYMHKNFEGP